MIIVLWFLADVTLSIQDLVDVQNMAWEARTKWYNLGLGLGLPADSLDAFDANAKKPEDSFRAMLSEWLRRHHPKPTWRALAKALKSPSVGLGQLAEQVTEEYSRM